MRKSKTHLALDRKTLRYTVNQRYGALTIHDTKTGVETYLYSSISHPEKERHGHPWTGLDAHALCDWLNERELGYPPLQTLPAHWSTLRHSRFGIKTR